MKQENCDVEVSLGYTVRMRILPLPVWIVKAGRESWKFEKQEEKKQK